MSEASPSNLRERSSLPDWAIPLCPEAYEPNTLEKQAMAPEECSEAMQLLEDIASAALEARSEGSTQRDREFVLWVCDLLCSDGAGEEPA